MSGSLLLANGAYIVAIVINLVALIFVLTKAQDRTQKVLFVLTNICLSIFLISHLIGTNVSDPLLSRNILFFNVVNVLIVAFNLHWVATMLGSAQRYKMILHGFYMVSGAFLVFYAFFPETFLLPSEPKLYFPNYYEPGSAYTLMRLYFGVAAVVILVWIVHAYARANPVQRNRLRYLFYTHLLAYLFGSTALFLVYDIPVDPVLSALLGLYTLPLGYAMVRYKLMDIRIFAWRSIAIVASVAAMAGLLFLTNAASNALTARADNVSPWLLPLVSALLAVAVGITVWRVVHRADRLKKEFISVVTHKVRGPLARISAASSALSEEMGSTHTKAYTQEIDNAAEQLLDLVGVIEAIETKDSEELYTFDRLRVGEVLDPIVEGMRERASKHGISLSREDDSEACARTFVFADSIQLARAFEAVIDNAIIYSPKGETVAIACSVHGGDVEIVVRDRGIGVPADALSFIGTTFFRAPNAEHKNIEGLGVSLYNAREIVRKHGGKLTISSRGEGRGTSVSIILPRVAQ